MKNIVLIGMPSAGKSTIGKYLSQKLGAEFVDTDEVVRKQDGRALRDIVIQEGLERFHDIQERAVLGLNLEGNIIATGGSVIYREGSLRHLAQKGILVFLKLPCEDIESRLAEGRRFARNDGQSFQELYLERMPLYEKYAELTIDCFGKTIEEIGNEIVKKITGSD